MTLSSRFPFRFAFVRPPARGPSTSPAAALAPSIAFALALAVPAAANSIDNGSFETGPDPGGTMQVAMGSTAITGWTVTRNAIDYVGTDWAAAEGSRSLALNGTGPGGVARTLATSTGAEYTVRFFMAGDAFSFPPLKNMRVTAAGQSQDFQFDASHAWPWDLGWTEKIFTFTAAGSSTTLEFYSLDAGDTGPTLDSVVVVGPSVGVPDGGRPGLALSPPRPNPARGSFAVSFTVPSEGLVRLGVYDVRGREVRVIEEGRLPSGVYERRWDGITRDGPAPGGVYFLRLEAAGALLVRKVVLSR